jgi:GTP-binding protein HflX
MQNKKRFILVDVVPPNIYREDAEKDLNELISLVDTYGGATIVRVIQRRSNPDPSTYVGSGKSVELAEIVKNEKIDGVVLNAIVKPGQLFNLRKVLWPSNNRIEVWDRVDLILHIFNKHAHTAESKLQIELASMRHMGPQIYGLGGTLLSRQGGGIGTRGIGETNIERMKRHWRSEMKEVKNKLEKLQRNRERQLENRREQGLKTVSIVGYTNAGKTTLFNVLTKKEKLEADVLFATLDSAVGKLYLPEKQRYANFLISDTIGFIQNLPPELIDAFKSTLMESVHADLLLHVIDISDPKMHEKITIVENILNELGVVHKKKIYVFNKIDAVQSYNKDEVTTRYNDYSPLFVSAKSREGVPELIQRLESELSEGVVYMPHLPSHQ